MQPAMTEAYVSLSFKILNPKGIEVMVTMREAEGAESDQNCFKRVNQMIERATEKGWQPVIAKSQPAATTAATVDTRSAPPQHSGNTSGSVDNVFTATSLNVEFNPKNGEKVGKLKGGQFTKHGVRLWPEAAAVLGIDFAQYPAGEHAITPVAVRYAVNDQNQPSKVLGKVV